ncbi:MDR family MFS transporter [Domibacillus epiphyticus]|uniref:MFS transporter n=1 Tax=Domibacillus epiphyticus TaxID=1714355 RepID=A0A1V2A5D4_9BACI|nr:MDR family MFS transporter [Domibacillus epiphyticus]OMP66221.1 MFS transporter [Domibacillus epiphyticus]
MSERQTNRPLVLAAVMLTMFMGAIEATIVATAMPDIVADLGGFSLYSWVFSAYLLMNAATVLIYGKLSDIFGRRPVLFAGIFIFLIGSILCGFAVSLEQLIVYRFIQGIGAGAIMPVATTIVGDIYTKEERAKVQGYLASVWGISAVSGPAIGGLLVEFVSWRWVFWINVPLGIISVIILFLYLHEKVEKKKPEIDYIGTILFLISVSAFMYLLVEAGKTAYTVPLLAAGIISLVFFVIHERRTPAPMIPFHLWKVRPILIANVVSLTTGVMLIGISTFLPTYVQGVMGESATVAGFTLTAMSIGWPLASSLSGRLLLSAGYRTTTLIGGAALLAGGLMFVFMDPSFGPWWAAASSFVTGVGMGLTSTAFIVSIQNSVDWHERGAATASNMFMRNIGNTIGAALLGGVLNSRLAAYLQNEPDAPASLSVDSINQLLGEGEGMTGKARLILSEGLTSSLHAVYWVVFFFAVVSFVLLLFLKKGD